MKTLFTSKRLSSSGMRSRAWLALAVVAAMAAVPCRFAGAATSTGSVGAQVGSAHADERSAAESTPPVLFGKSQAYLDMLERYLSLMEKFARMTEDPAASGSAAVLSAREMLTSDGDTNRAIDYFTQVLPDVKNEAVQRTIHIELSELYKHAGQTDKALEQLRILMISAPPGPSARGEARTPLSDATPTQQP
jgi:hypothetical protein